MIKDKKEIESRGIEIDLTGPQGNAFWLIGYAGKLAPQLGYERNEIIKELRDSKSYEELLEIFDGYFGGYITLYR